MNVGNGSVNLGKIISGICNWVVILSDGDFVFILIVVSVGMVVSIIIKGEDVY